MRQWTTNKVKKQIPLELNNWTAVNRISLANCSHPDLGLSHQCCKLSCPLPGIAKGKTKLSTQCFSSRALMQFKSDCPSSTNPNCWASGRQSSPSSGQANDISNTLGSKSISSFPIPWVAIVLHRIESLLTAFIASPFGGNRWMLFMRSRVNGTWNTSPVHAGCILTHTWTKAHLCIQQHPHFRTKLLGDHTNDLLDSGWLLVTWKSCLVWTCLDLPKAAATVTTKDPTLYGCSLTPMTPPAGQTSRIPTLWCPESGQSAGREGHQPCQWPSINMIWKHKTC